MRLSLPWPGIGGEAKDLPEVPGEGTIHIAKAVDATLGRYSDPGDHPRWTGRDIRAEGPVAVARTRAMLQGLQDKAPDLADAYLWKLFALPLPQGTPEALNGQGEPERVPVGVLKEEWEERRKPDIAVEPLDKRDPEGCAVPMVDRPGEVYDCKLGGWRRETPEDQAGNGPQRMLEGVPEGSDPVTLDHQILQDYKPMDDAEQGARKHFEDWLTGAGKDDTRLEKIRKWIPGDGEKRTVPGMVWEGAGEGSIFDRDDRSNAIKPVHDTSVSRFETWIRCPGRIAAALDSRSPGS